MKSSNKHKIRSPEKLEEDMTDILWAAAAGGGLFALAKGWDKWGKDAAASLPFATKGMKAAKIDRAKEKKDKEIEIATKIADDPKSSEKDKEEAEKDLEKLMSPVDKAERETGKKEKEKGDTEKIEKGKVATGEYSTDKAGIIDNQGDAQKYREATGSAPEGWASSNGPGKDPDETPGKPAKGIVWTSDDEEKWKDDEEKRKEDEKDKKVILVSKDINLRLKAKSLGLYAEHTWGADRSINKPKSDETKMQWIMKQVLAYEGFSIARMLRRDGMEKIAKTMGGDKSTTIAFNTLPFKIKTFVMIIL